MAVPHAAKFGHGLMKVPSQTLKSWYMNFFQLRGISDKIVRRNDWALIRKLWRDWSPGYDLSQEEWDELRSVFNGDGVLRAMLSYYRSNATPSKLLGLRKSAMTTLTTVPVPRFEIKRVADTGHFLHREMPEAINRLIIDWLKQHK